MLPALCTALWLGAAAETPPSSSSATAAPPTTTDPSAPKKAERTRLLVLDVTGDLEESARRTLAALIATRLARFASLDVVSRDNLTRLIEVETDRQLAGCDGADGACVAELAAALDVDLVVVASAGRLGGATVFTLQIVDAQGTVKGRGSAQVSALDDLAAKVTTVVDDAGRAVTGEEPADVVPLRGPDPMTVEPAPSPLRLPLLVGGGVAAGVGVTAAVVGATPALLYGGAARDLNVLRVQYVESEGDRVLLDQAAKKQKQADTLRALWNNVGIYAVWGGLLVAVAGGGALAAGFLVEDGGTP